MLLLKETAFWHGHVLNVAGDPRAQFNPLDRGQRAGELDKRRHRTNDHFGHRNAW